MLHFFRLYCKVGAVYSLIAVTCISLYKFHTQEAWYTPAVEGEHAKGFIEERLKNVRKRMPKQGWTSLEPSSSSEENQKEPSTKEKIEELKSKGMLMCLV